MKTYLAAFWAALSAAINVTRDAYLAVVDWIDDNPQKSLWIAAAVVIGALVV